MAKDKEKDKAEKAPAPAEKPDADKAPAAEPAKKGLPIKAIAVIMAMLAVEGAGLFLVLKMTGAPRVTAAADEEHHEEGGDDHAKSDDDGHGAAKKDDGHGAAKKKDDGHGAAKKKDDGHGAAKKDDGHGAKKGDAAPSSSGVVETLVAKERFPNGHSGRTWLWDVEIYVQALSKNEERVTSVLTSRAAEVKTGLARIWRTAQHSHFNEPGLETLTRQVAEFLDGLIGPTADGKSFIERVLIPRCVGYPTEY